MTKKERVIAAIKGQEVDAIPSSFSLHFPAEVAYGDAAVKAHLDFFRATDTDILKIMNENLVPGFGQIKNAADYRRLIPTLTMQDQFMQDQVELTKQILDNCDPSGFTLGTLHGAVASGIHPLEKMGLTYDETRAFQLELLREDAEATLDGMKRITDVMCQLAETYVKMGVDAVYYAALGAESRYMTDEEFATWIEPLDKQVLTAIKEAGGYCFLHMCKDELNMQRYKNYAAYADVVNWGVYEAPFSLDEGRKLFPGLTVMGGFEARRGVLVDGTVDDIKQATHAIIDGFGRTGFILGADCTLATEQDLGKVRAAVDAARE